MEMVAQSSSCCWCCCVSGAGDGEWHSQAPSAANQATAAEFRVMELVLLVMEMLMDHGFVVKESLS